MVTLGSDLTRQRAAGISPCSETVEYVAEIIAGMPAQILAGSLINIHSVDIGKHLPTPTCILRFVLRNSPLHYSRRIHPQVMQIIKLKRSGCADNVSPETDHGSMLDGEQMSFDDIRKVHPPVEILIRFCIGVIIRLANRPVVIFFWKKSRRSQDDARKSLISVEQFTQIFSPRLCHAVDVFGNWSDILSYPCRRRP